MSFRTEQVIRDEILVQLTTVGSANWTRRNLGNLSLEANVLLNRAGRIGQEFDAYFDSFWTSAKSHDYIEYADESWLRLLFYRFQEWSGVSTF